MSAWFAAAPSAWFGTPADQLAEARAAAAADAQPDRCSIKGWLTVKDRRGNQVNSAEVTIATDVPIRVQRDPRPIFMAESGGAYGRAGETIDTTAQAFVGSLPWGTPVQEDHHIVMADRTRLEVTSVDNLSSFGVEVIVGMVRLGIDQPGAGEDG